MTYFHVDQKPLHVLLLEMPNAQLTTAHFWIYFGSVDLERKAINITSTEIPWLFRIVVCSGSLNFYVLKDD